MNKMIRKLLESIGQYGVQCSETKELAPPYYLTDAIDAIERALARYEQAEKELPEEPQRFNEDGKDRCGPYVFYDDYVELRAHAAKVTAEARKDQIQLAAAKYIVWSARWAFTKILSQGLILPHAEWEHFNEMLPQVERWLVINDQVAVNFKEGAADLAAAIERPTEFSPPCKGRVDDE